jgi:hypothetical protein
MMVLVTVVVPKTVTILVVVLLVGEMVRYATEPMIRAASTVAIASPV